MALKHKALKTLLEKKEMLVISISPFSLVFSTLTEISQAIFNLSSADAFNFVLSNFFFFFVC